MTFFFPLKQFETTIFLFILTLIISLKIDGVGRKFNHIISLKIIILGNLHSEVYKTFKTLQPNFVIYPNLSK